AGVVLGDMFRRVVLEAREGAPSAEVSVLASLLSVFRGLGQLPRGIRLRPRSRRALHACRRKAPHESPMAFLLADRRSRHPGAAVRTRALPSVEPALGATWRDAELHPGMGRHRFRKSLAFAVLGPARGKSRLGAWSGAAAQKAVDGSFGGLDRRLLRRLPARASRRVSRDDRDPAFGPL